MLAVHVGNLLGEGGPLLSGRLGSLFVGRHQLAPRRTWVCPVPEEAGQVK